MPTNDIVSYVILRLLAAGWNSSGNRPASRVVYEKVEMDTSIQVRFVMLGVVFAGAMVVAFANLRLAFFLLLRKKVSRAAKLVWPSLGVLIAFSVFNAFKVEPNRIQITRHIIRTSKLPDGSRIRIVHITDMHMVRIGAREIQMINLTAREAPDVIVLTGDYTIVKNRESISHLRQIALRLSNIAPVYAVEGNWDIECDLIALRQGGVQILNDWNVVRSKDGKTEIALAGMSWYPNSAPPKLSTAYARFYKVCLCHKPEKFDLTAKSGIDLLLAGHTHGGQVRLPVFGALIPHKSLVGKYQMGMYEKQGCLLYVNRGIGLESPPAPQVRFLCRPEIAVIDVTGMKN